MNVERKPTRPKRHTGNWPAAAPGTEDSAPTVDAFRIVIAVHRPRFRVRVERAAANNDWSVVSLLNRQDPVGLVARPPRPPNILILSGDFGRQKDYGIFRAVQQYRSRGMVIVGMAPDCSEAIAGFPGLTPAQLCDFCIPPPYLTEELRALLQSIHDERRPKRPSESVS